MSNTTTQSVLFPDLISKPIVAAFYSPRSHPRILRVPASVARL